MNGYYNRWKTYSIESVSGIVDPLGERLKALVDDEEVSAASWATEMCCPKGVDWR